MNIINRSLNVKNNKIKYYLSKLPDIYKTCDIPILFVDNNYFGYLIHKYYSVKYNCPNFCKKEFSEIGGTCWYAQNGHKTIFIIIKVQHKLTVPMVLFHELRHWYQQTHLKDFHIEYTKVYNDDVTIDGYSKQHLELDANKFAKMHCKKLGIKFYNSKNEFCINKNQT
jgi:hypothetical protein